MKKPTLPLIQRIRLLPAEEREALRRRALDPHSTTDTFPFVLYLDKGVYPYVQKRNAEYGRESFGRPERILIVLDQLAERQNSASSSAEVSPDGNGQKAPAPLPCAAKSPAPAEQPSGCSVPVGLGSVEDSATHRLPQLTLDPTTDSIAPAEPAEKSQYRHGGSMIVPTSLIGFAVALLAITGTLITVRIFSSLEMNLPVPAEEWQNSNSLFENSQESHAGIDQGTGLLETGRMASASAEAAAGRSWLGRNTAAADTDAILPSRLNCDSKEPSTAEGEARAGTTSNKPVIERGQPNPALANSTVPSRQFAQAAEPFTRVLEELILRAGLRAKPHTLALGHTIMPGVEIRGDFANLCNDATREDRRMSPFRGLRGDWANVRSLFFCPPSLVIFARDFDHLVAVYRQEFGRVRTDEKWIDTESGLTYIVHGDCIEICERRTP